MKEELLCAEVLSVPEVVDANSDGGSVDVVTLTGDDATVSEKLFNVEMADDVLSVEDLVVWSILIELYVDIDVGI